MRKRMTSEETMEKIAKIIKQLSNGEITGILANEIRKPFDKIIRKSRKALNYREERK